MKLQALRSFSLGGGQDIMVGEVFDESEIGVGRANQLCNGSNPACKRLVEPPPTEPNPEPKADPAPQQKKWLSARR